MKLLRDFYFFSLGVSSTIFLVLLSYTLVDSLTILIILGIIIFTFNSWLVRKGVIKE